MPSPLGLYAHRKVLTVCPAVFSVSSERYQGGCNPAYLSLAISSNTPAQPGLM
ncbi:hypothetical protein [Varibaculum timonense]|uniref:hypothetical protein n=1 Tax=Varibaculum timonense TaxID=1964383 RepID=UPI0022E7CF4D|nr:hypothetical protein [Varibaculum timonense]